MDIDQLKIAVDDTLYYPPSINTGEKRMAYALLCDALEEIGFLRRRKTQRNISFRMWRQTRDWILTRDPDFLCLKDSYVSFDFIVVALGLDPLKLRKHLIKQYCACCNVQILRQPCRTTVRRVPKNASKCYLDPQFWVDKKDKFRLKKVQPRQYRLC